MDNNQFLTDWGLSLIVFLPLVGALVMMLIPKAEEQLLKVVALVASLASAGVGVAVLADFDYDNADKLQFLVDKTWIEVISSRYLVALDGISLPLLALTLLITPLVIIYSWNHFPEPHNPKAFLILILVLHTGMLGSFVAQDLILFFVFFELVLLPMYFMIGVWGGENRQYAAIKFFLFTLFGSALMIVSFLAVFFVTGGESFSMVELAKGVAERSASGDLAMSTQVLIFGGMFLIAKSTREINHQTEGEDETLDAAGGKKKVNVTGIIIQIILLDIIFSFDSILTAVGLTNDVIIMIIAVVLSIGIMIIFSGSISEFIQKHPSMEVLALGFLILIGFMIFLEGLDKDIPKGYIYFAVVFSMLIEMVNIRVRNRRKRAKAEAHE